MTSSPASRPPGRLHASLWMAMASFSPVFAAQAESNASSAPLGRASGLSASSQLDFRVVIPAVLFMQVGTGNLAPGTAGFGPAPVTARLVSNNKNASLTPRGSVGGLTNGVDSIPWSQIVPSVGGTLPHPALGDGLAGDGSAAAATAMLGTGQVLVRSSSWSFSHRNTNTLPIGYYGGHVTYTAAMP